MSTKTKWLHLLGSILPRSQLKKKKRKNWRNKNTSRSKRKNRRQCLKKLSAIKNCSLFWRSFFTSTKRKKSKKKSDRLMKTSPKTCWNSTLTTGIQIKSDNSPTLNKWSKLLLSKKNWLRSWWPSSRKVASKKVSVIGGIMLISLLTLWKSGMMS